VSSYLPPYWRYACCACEAQCLMCPPLSRYQRSSCWRRSWPLVDAPHLEALNLSRTACQRVRPRSGVRPKPSCGMPPVGWRHGRPSDSAHR
jgi:hypothetical protein